MTVARQLAEFLAGVSVADLPPQSIDHAAMLIASTIASAAAGTQLESARIIRDLACERGGKPEASLWFAADARVPIADAAQANAVLSDAAASDDSDLRNIVHAGTPLTAVSLAIAERDGCSGQAVLAAIVCGYEAAGRISEAITPGFRARGFHGCHGAVFAASVAASQLLQLDAAQMATGGLDVLFLLGADEIEVAPGPFVVYIGTHGDRGAHRADVILPGAAYPEKSAIYVNTEGRVQMANRAAFPPGDAREDWAILRALSDALGHKLPYDSLGALRQAMFAAHPHLMQIDQIAAGDAAAIKKLAKLGGTLEKAHLRPSVADFYFTNPIARASAIMAECSALAHAAIKTEAE